MSEIDAVRINELMRAARARNASDLHFGGGTSPALRIDGRLTLLDAPAPAAPAIDAFLATVLSEGARLRLHERGTADAGVRSGDAGPLRIHAYRESGRTRVAIRLLAATIPRLDDLALPPIVASLTRRASGLILFTGPTGCGKTTALAALLDTMNRDGERTIMTVEDPIEYVHVPRRSLIAQCEIGRDVCDYSEALRGFMRSDPDVIFIGEMRDRETIEAALRAAETGHLVVATLHTNDAPQTVDRIVDAVPSGAQGQVRAQLAAVLVAVVNLRLVPRTPAPGRRPAAEILIATDAVRAMIREGKTHHLRNAIATGRNVGMQTLEAHLSELVMRHHVMFDAAVAVANRPAEVRVAGTAATVTG